MKFTTASKTITINPSAPDIFKKGVDLIFTHVLFIICNEEHGNAD